MARATGTWRPALRLLFCEAWDGGSSRAFRLEALGIRYRMDSEGSPMRATSAAVMCAGAVALAGCCFDYNNPRSTASIRQASTKPAMSEQDRARASQAKQCDQRHI